MITMETWTREELEALVPFDQATKQIGDEVFSLTQEEYDAWIASGVGTEKHDDGPLGGE